MRVYISNTAYNQAWQREEDVAAGREPMSVNVETGDGIPSWDLKIEGRLLDVSLSPSTGKYISDASCLW
jgi:SWI/SNF-related matrix-associated actin-dependent regulator of chromatin subfamily D